MYLHAERWVAQDQTDKPHRLGLGLLQDNYKQPSDFSPMDWESLPLLTIAGSKGAGYRVKQKEQELNTF